MSYLLQHTDHRPWEPPARPWTMTQTWEHLLFAHWPLPEEVLQPFIPAGLELQTFDGQAWIAVVPFRMTWVRPRWLPAAPWISFFPELNIRTYVTDGKKPGVWFFSLDASNALAVQIARRFYHLPYYHARMGWAADAERRIHYHSTRVHRDAAPAHFEATYGPTGDVYHSTPGTLEHWLTERYCLYATDKHKRLHRAEIHHVPWPLQPARADIQVNTMLAPYDITLPGLQPILHYARHIRVLVWPLKPLENTK